MKAHHFNKKYDIIMTFMSLNNVSSTFETINCCAALYIKIKHGIALYESKQDCTALREDIQYYTEGLELGKNG